MPILVIRHIVRNIDEVCRNRADAEEVPIIVACWPGEIEGLQSKSVDEQVNDPSSDAARYGLIWPRSRIILEDIESILVEVVKRIRENFKIICH